MSDAPLPSDVPRLRTIEWWLLLQLAAVRAAIQQAEDGPPRGQGDTTPRYVIQWRWVKRGQPRLGVLHHADCWMATGDRLTWRQVQLERDGRRIEPCDTCRPTSTAPRPR